MKLSDKKKIMLHYTDLLGQDFSDKNAIIKSKNDSDLKKVCDDHIQFLELQVLDVISGVEELKQKLKLY